MMLETVRTGYAPGEGLWGIGGADTAGIDPCYLS